MTLITTTDNAVQADVAAELEQRIHLINADIQRRIRDEASSQSNSRRVDNLILRYAKTRSK